MRRLYYVLFPEIQKFCGPMTFKEALKYKERCEWMYSSTILKLVVDEKGKEVK